MKSVALFSFLFVGLEIATVEGKEPIAPPLQTFEEVKSAPEPTTRDPSVLQLAKWCNRELCKPPDCRCSSTQIPGEYLPSETPQFVTITFDGGVNIRNMETYREVLYGRKNSNGCPAGTTFYVNHEYTNYRFVNELYNQGYEIGLHSISHRVPQDYWANANYNVIKEEIVDQRLQMSHFANIPIESIKGVRLPFLQLSGNTSFQVMADHGLEYDSSWPDSTVQLHRDHLWPYTLDYRSTQGCPIGPCPTASIPKLWVQPMASWIDRQGFPCAMADSCFLSPWLDDEEGWYEFILTNFRRHYLKNRAPFGIYLRESFLSSNPAVKAAFIRFMDLISDLPDAFMVNTNEVIDWIKDPIPVREYRTKSCKTWREASCRRWNCGPLSSNHNEKRYYLEVCTGWPCPTVYPWTGDPFGHQRPITTARPINLNKIH